MSADYFASVRPRAPVTPSPDDDLIRQMSHDRLCPAVMALILSTTEKAVLSRRRRLGCQPAPFLQPKSRKLRVYRKARP